jgi:hypothetical protein
MRVGRISSASSEKAVALSVETTTHPERTSAFSEESVAVHAPAAAVQPEAPAEA